MKWEAGKPVFDENGDIKEVKMTTQGIEGPIDAKKRIDAWRACCFYRQKTYSDIGENFFWKYPVTGWRKTVARNTIRNEKDTGVRAFHYVENGVHKEYLTKFKKGDSAVYRYLDFGDGVSGFRCSASSYLAHCRIEIHLDGEAGPLIGSCEITDTNGFGPWNFKTFSCSVKSVTGVHEVCLTTYPEKGECSTWLCDLDWFEFI